MVALTPRRRPHHPSSYPLRPVPRAGAGSRSPAAADGPSGGRGRRRNAGSGSGTHRWGRRACRRRDGRRRPRRRKPTPAVDHLEVRGWVRKHRQHEPMAPPQGPHFRLAVVEEASHGFLAGLEGVGPGVVPATATRPLVRSPLVATGCWQSVPAVRERSSHATLVLGAGHAPALPEVSPSGALLVELPQHVRGRPRASSRRFVGLGLTPLPARRSTSGYRGAQRRCRVASASFSRTCAVPNPVSETGKG